MLSLVQEWLDIRNLTLITDFLDTSVHGDSRCTDPRISLLLVKYLKVLELALFDNSLKAAFLPVSCAPFPSTLFLLVNFP